MAYETNKPFAFNRTLCNKDNDIEALATIATGETTSVFTPCELPPAISVPTVLDPSVASQPSPKAKPKQKHKIKLPSFTNKDYNLLCACIQKKRGRDEVLAPLCVHFLILVFNPLVVRVANQFRLRWTGDFADLVLLVRSRFIRQLHRYEVGGRFYFRYWLPRALYYDVRDVVRKDRKGQGLNKWSDAKEEPPESNEGLWMRPTDQIKEMTMRLDAQSALDWIRTTDEIADVERDVFLAWIQGYNLREIKRLVKVPVNTSVPEIVERVQMLVRRFA